MSDLKGKTFNIFTSSTTPPVPPVPPVEEWDDSEKDSAQGLLDAADTPIVADPNWEPTEAHDALDEEEH